MQFLMKNCVKYFNSFVTIANPKPNLSYTKMISTKSSTNGESLTQFERVHCNHGRNSTESPICIYMRLVSLTGSPNPLLSHKVLIIFQKILIFLPVRALV